MAASSSPVKTFNKDPLALLDYTLDWQSWLGPDDTIVSVSWTVPVGIANAGVLQSGTTVTIWLSGGTAGTSYAVYVSITTVAGRTDKRTFTLNVIER